MVDKAHEASERLAQAEALKPGIEAVRLLGRDIPVLLATDGTPRANEKGKRMSALAARTDIARAFGDRFTEVRVEMEALAATLPPEELNRIGFRLYEKFRPEVPRGAEGRGAKGVLNIERIRSAANIRRI